MGEIIVVYDPAKEIAALVDVDNKVGFGPAMIGPDAETKLDAFLQSVAYDVTEVDSAVLRDWFDLFVTATFPATASPTSEDSPVAASDLGSDGMADAALAEHTATESGPAPPEPAPADTDASPHESTADTVIDCPACNASGVVPSSVPGESVTCNLCKGTTKITVAA